MSLPAPPFVRIPRRQGQFANNQAAAPAPKPYVWRGHGAPFTIALGPQGQATNVQVRLHPNTFGRS